MREHGFSCPTWDREEAFLAGLARTLSLSLNLNPSLGLTLTLSEELLASIDCHSTAIPAFPGIIMDDDNCGSQVKARKSEPRPRKKKEEPRPRKKAENRGPKAHGQKAQVPV